VAGGTKAFFGVGTWEGERGFHGAFVGEEVAQLWCLCVGIAGERCYEVVIISAGAAGSSSC
jgi:hypothetical protein